MDETLKAAHGFHRTMSGAVGTETRGGHALPSVNVGKVTAMGTALVALNILLMLALSYTPVAPFAAGLFSNFFIGIAVFVVTVGGGFWVASKGIESGSMALAAVGVALTQSGYGLFGAAILAPFPGIRVPAIGISVVITGVLTAAIAYYVFNTTRSFAGWQSYSFYLFIGGFALGAAGVFTTPLLLVAASLCFFAGFIVDLVYELWAVRENRYASELRNALGIYVAVMGVFVHVLMYVLRVLSLLEN
jgi:hypothetical protein